VKGVSIFSSPASTILLNTLTVVTFTKQESTLTIFKNEKQVASITSPVGITVTNNRMYLGYNFRGIFDKVAIYPTFLKDCPTLKCFSAARAPYKSIRPCIFTFYLSDFFFSIPQLLIFIQFIHFSSNCL